MKLGSELSGILVVSIEQAVAAPYCGLLLADAGARVIKVERPSGDFARNYDSCANGQSVIFAWLNRGKESVSLNLKTSKDLAILRSILRQADILISNLAPGAIERMKLTGNVLRKENSKLITCSITGYDTSDLHKSRKAYDFLIQGETGICSVTGTEENPSKVGISLSDLSTGLTAFSAILRALIQRSNTDRGIDIQISMFDVMADWMNMPLLAHKYMGGAPKRTGLEHSFIAPYGAFTCGDGSQILISIQNNHEFTSFCNNVLKHPKLSDDLRFTENPKRYRNRLQLNRIITECFSRYDIKVLTSLLDKHKIANARLNSVAELSKHPFLKTDMTKIGNFKIEVASLPVKTNHSKIRKAPSLNENVKEILSEFKSPKK